MFPMDRPTKHQVFSTYLSLSLLLRIEVIEQDGPLLALLAPIPHHDAGAIDNLSSVAFAVQHTCDVPLISLETDTY